MDIQKVINGFRGRLFMRKGHGNTELHQRRFRRLNKHIKRRDVSYEMIDGNFTYYPYAYCTNYQGFLTIMMETTHSCEGKNCPHYHKQNVEHYIKEYDKIYGEHHNE